MMSSAQKLRKNLVLSGLAVVAGTNDQSTRKEKQAKNLPRK